MALCRRFWMCHWKCVKQGTQRDCTSLHDLERSKVSRWSLHIRMVSEIIGCFLVFLSLLTGHGIKLIKLFRPLRSSRVNPFSSLLCNLIVLLSLVLVRENISVYQKEKMKTDFLGIILTFAIYLSFCRFYRNWWSVWTSSKLRGAYAHKGRSCMFEVLNLQKYTYTFALDIMLSNLMVVG